MSRNYFSLLASLLLACLIAPCAQGVTFKEVARFDVAGSADSNSPASFIGNNPSAVAWNGRQLYIAGFNSSGGTADTAIIEITNALSTGVNIATFSPKFGVLSTPNSRGYSGLDVAGGVLAAAYDDGAADPNGIQAFAVATNSLNWAKNARGGSGVAFDPGFASADSGVAWTTFGSGRRALQDTSTGADIYTTGDGMIINVGSGTFWRDMTFDPATGDIYARRSNGIIKGTRTGGNLLTGLTELIPVQGATDFFNGQMIGFLDTTLAGDLLIYNDRPSTALGQMFTNVVKLLDPSGSAVSATFALIGGGAPADGNGYYDFDWDPQTQTLAVADFANRNVHIFSVVPEPTSLAMVLGGGLALVAGRRRRS